MTTVDRRTIARLPEATTGWCYRCRRLTEWSITVGGYVCEEGEHSPVDAPKGHNLHEYYPRRNR